MTEQTGAIAETPFKRKRGRPKGSKNKKKVVRLAVSSLKPAIPSLKPATMAEVATQLRNQLLMSDRLDEKGKLEACSILRDVMRRYA